MFVVLRGGMFYPQGGRLATEDCCALLCQKLVRLELDKTEGQLGAQPTMWRSKANMHRLCCD
jgi:hypothetical protein